MGLSTVIRNFAAQKKKVGKKELQSKAVTEVAAHFEQMGF